jgi:broad specificity phosphatase PhoE
MLSAVIALLAVTAASMEGAHRGGRTKDGVLVSAAAPTSCDAPTLSLLPLPSAQRDPPRCAAARTLHLVRHAEGTHNEAEQDEEARVFAGGALAPENATLRDEHGMAWMLLERVSGRAHYDAQLTRKGAAQALALRTALVAERLHVDAVLVSPMRRAMQTALLGVPQLSTGLRDGGGGVVGAASVPVIASELLRERVGEYTCDGRLKASELRAAAFGDLTATPPAVDYGGMPEEDEMYLHGRESGPREAELLAARVGRAARWLLDVPCGGRADAEGCSLAVVSHKFLLHALTALVPPARDPDGAARTLFANAERRAFVLCAAPPPLGCESAGAEKAEL